MLTISIFSNRNIFNTQCQTIVNTVNCVGVMGKGIALEMKTRYPVMFEKYKKLCKDNLIDIGKLWLYKEPDDKWILNFPTKTHWKYKDKNIESIAFPMLGCSNGGLETEKVLEIMVKHLSKCDNLIVEIYK